MLQGYRAGEHEIKGRTNVSTKRARGPLSRSKRGFEGVAPAVKAAGLLGTIRQPCGTCRRRRLTVATTSRTPRFSPSPWTTQRSSRKLPASSPSLSTRPPTGGHGRPTSLHIRSRLHLRGRLSDLHELSDLLRRRYLRRPVTDMPAVLLDLRRQLAYVRGLCDLRPGPYLQRELDLRGWRRVRSGRDDVRVLHVRLVAHLLGRAHLRRRRGAVSFAARILTGSRTR